MRLTRDGLVTSLLVVGALFVGSALEDRVPDATDLFSDRFEVGVRIGEPASLRTGIVTVTDVRSARELTHNMDIATTAQVFLVVDLTWEPTGSANPLILSSVTFETADGVRYAGQPGLQTYCGQTNPGLPVDCVVHFELPADRIAGGHLLVPSLETVDGSDVVAVVDLGLDGNVAESLATAPEDRIDITPEESL